MSGIGLGVMGMIGLLILLFVFKMQPADPPLEVMLIILSVVTAAAALQAAGGMDYLVNLAGKSVWRQPLDHRVGVEKCAVDALRRRTQDPMKLNGARHYFLLNRINRTSNSLDWRSPRKSSAPLRTLDRCVEG